MDEDFKDIPTTTLADVLGRERVMDVGMRPLWAGMPRWPDRPSPCGARPGTT